MRSKKPNKKVANKTKSQRLCSVFALFCLRRHETWSILINYLISERHNSNSPGANFDLRALVERIAIFSGFNRNAISHRRCALYLFRSFFGIHVIAAAAAAVHAFKFNSVIVPFIPLYIVFDFFSIDCTVIRESLF